MRLRERGLVRTVGIGLLACVTTAAGCGGPHSAFADPASEAAEAIGWLWWVLLAVTSFVFVAVMAGWGYALFRRRRGTDGEGVDGGGAEAAGAEVRGEGGDGRSLVWILVLGAIVPATLLLGLTVATIHTSNRVGGAAGAADALLVEVVGHQFWWEARYPESGALTANEIHIPAGRPVRVRLTTNDVIHSFWIPRLQGKLDMIPGRTTELLLNAPAPGVYRGFCAEFCGLQHALMGLRIVAQPEVEFTEWARHNAAPIRPGGGPPTLESPTTAPLERPVPSDESSGAVSGAELFTRYDCHLCHAVRGAGFPQPVDPVGPDLTHVGSRETLAAVTLENTPENMAEWIRDPHQFKPGALMPATPLPEDELRTLVRYLEGLR